MEKLGHWLQILSGIALVVGVALVIMQMRQTERLTRAQMTSDWFIQRAAQAGTAAGENPMRAYAKLCDPASKLTTEDAAVLHALFLQRLYMGIQGRIVSNVAEFGEDEFWKNQLQSNLNLVVGTPQGKAWFEKVATDRVTTETVRESPYYGLDCGESDSSPLQALIEADAEFKASAQERPN